MRESLTRAELLAAGATAFVAGSVHFWPGGDTRAAAPPSAPGTVPDDDLAYVRLLIAFELLAIDFYGNALRSRRLDQRTSADVRAALANEHAHYAFLAGTIVAAGATPLRAADIDFTYPKDAFYTAASVMQLALELETVGLGAYLGAAGVVVTPALQSTLVRISANEAQHQSTFARLDRKPAFEGAFPQQLTIEEASAALGTYTS